MKESSRRASFVFAALLAIAGAAVVITMRAATLRGDSSAPRLPPAPDSPIEAPTVAPAEGVVKVEAKTEEIEPPHPEVSVLGPDEKPTGEPTTTVEVELLRDGKRLRSKALVRLMELLPKDDGTKAQHMLRASPVTAGFVVFKDVPLGLEMAAIVEWDDGRFHSDLSTPPRTAANSNLRLRVDLAPTPRLTLRIVDQEGKPRPGLPINAILFGADAVTSNLDPNSDARVVYAEEKLRADGDARIRIAYPIPEIARPEYFLTLYERIEGIDQGVVKLRVTPSVTPGEHDLGDVALALTEPFASGTVRFADGEPAAKASIEVCVDAWATANDPSPTREWTLHAADDGTFQISALDVPRNFRLFASHDEAPPSPIVECKGPALSLDLRLGASGSIVGSLALPKELADGATLYVHQPWKPDSMDSLALQRGMAGSGRHLDLHEPGPFFVPGLKPGAYDVKLGVKGAGTVATVQNVEVHADEVTRDPRLQELGSGVVLRPITLKVVDAATLAPVGAWVWVCADERNSDIELTRESAPVKTDFTLWVGAAGVTVTIQSYEYRTVVLNDVRESRTVKLVREAGVSLRVRGIPPGSLEAGMGFNLHLQPLAEDGSDLPGDWRYRHDAIFAGTDKHGLAQVIFAGCGRYRVHWRVVRAPWKTDADEKADPTTELTIPDHSTPITIDLDPPPGLLH